MTDKLGQRETLTHSLTQAFAYYTYSLTHDTMSCLSWWRFCGRERNRSYSLKGAKWTRQRVRERECVYIAADQRGRLCCDARLRSIALFRESFWVPKSPVHSWYTPTVSSVCLSIYMFVRPIFPVSVCCQRWVASVVLTWLVQYPTAAAGAEAHILSLSILA